MENVRDFNQDLEMDFGRLARYTRWLDVLDKKFGKPDNGDLIVLVGYPWMWKTEFSFFMSRQNLKKGNRVAYLSLELTKKQLIHRIARKSAWVSYQDFQNGNYSERQIEIIKQEIQRFKEQDKLWMIWANNEPSIDELEELIRECNDKWFQMIFIDNLGKIEWCATDLDRQAKTTSKLQTIKNELNLDITLLHHLRKPSKSDVLKPWWGSAFSGSQKIKDNCSVMVEIRRDLDPYETRPEKKAEVLFLQYKQTWDGITWAQEMYFNRWEYNEHYIPN